MTINLHELANMPGAGNAEKALRKAGCWDDKPVYDLEYKNEATGEVHRGNMHEIRKSLKEATE